MIRIDDTARRLPRQQIADPHHMTLLRVRLEQARAVDLRDNADIVELGGGYATIEPRDANKRHGG